MATGYVDPNGDNGGGTSGPFSFSLSPSDGVYYTKVNGGTRSPTSPGTSSSISGTGSGGSGNRDFDMTTLTNVASITSITVYLWGGIPSGGPGSCSLNVNINGSWKTAVQVFSGSGGAIANQWWSATFTRPGGETWDQTTLNILLTRLVQSSSGGGIVAHEMYAEVNYTETAGGAAGLIGGGVYGGGAGLLG